MSFVFLNMFDCLDASSLSNIEMVLVKEQSCRWFYGKIDQKPKEAVFLKSAWVIPYIQMRLALEEEILQKSFQNLNELPRRHQPERTLWNVSNSCPRKLWWRLLVWCCRRHFFPVLFCVCVSFCKAQKLRAILQKFSFLPKETEIRVMVYAW